MTATATYAAPLSWSTDTAAVASACIGEIDLCYVILANIGRAGFSVARRFGDCITLATEAVSMAEAKELAQDDAAEILGRHLAVTGEDVVADRAREDADGAAMADNDCDGLA
jgi:hypothetical protein